MIKIPRGRAVYKELKSSFIRVEKLLEDLSKNGFSGVVEMIGLKHEAEILLDNGQVANVRLRGEAPEIGCRLLGKVVRLAEEENLLISTYKLPPESVVFFSSFLESETVYENLSSEFADPAKLIAKFEQENGEFCLEAIFSKNLGSGLLFIHDGHVVEAVLYLLGKDLSTGGPAVGGVVDGVRELGAVMNVYRGRISVEHHEAPVPKAEIFLEDVRVVCEQILHRFRALAAETAKKIQFDTFFREACLSMADRFPFLDPFAAELNYRGERLELATSEPARSVVEGLLSCVGEMVRRLEKERTSFPSAEFRQSTVDVLVRNYPSFVEGIDLNQIFEIAD